MYGIYGFMVWCLGFIGLSFTVLGFRISGLVFMVYCLEFVIWVWGIGFGI